QGLVMTGRVEELSDQLAPARQPEPRRVPAARTDRGFKPEPQRRGGRARIGKIENEPGTLVPQVAEECLLRSGVGRPPEHQRQVGFEQRTYRTRNEIHGVWSRA